MRKLLIGLSAALLASSSVPALSNTLTTNYSLNKPTVGADANNWGNLTNSNWDSLDSIIFGMCPKTGCTFTGGVTGVTFDGATPNNVPATFTGVLASGVLTASSVTGTIVPGYAVGGTGVTAGTTITSQLTGTPGGAGNYQTSGTQSVSSEAMTATNLGSTGAFRVRGNATSGFGTLQVTDSTGSTEWGNFKFQPNTGGVDTGPAAWTGGAFTFNSPLSVSGATTLSSTLGVTGASNLSSLSVSGASTYAGQATFTNSQGPIISAGTAASSATYLIARPTDFAAGKPELFFAGNSSAGSFLLSTFDGNTFGTGSLSMNFSSVALAGSLSVSNGLTVTGPLSLPAGSVTNANLVGLGGSGFKGNNTGGGGVQDLTPAQAGAMIPGVPRAWAVFSGSSSNGPVTIFKSFNISSVVRNAAGNYSVGFSAGLPDNSYAVSITCTNNGSNFNISVTVANGTEVAGGFGFNSNLSSGGGFDCAAYHVIIMD